MNETMAKARCWAEVLEDGLIANYREALSLLKPGVKMICVLKADGYGLGAAEVGQTLWEQGARHFAVACFTEARELIAALPEAFVLVLGRTADCEMEEAVRLGLRLTAGSGEELHALSAAAGKLGLPARVHIKLDTGLHRLGFLSGEEALPYLALQDIDYEGLYSHLALRGPEQTERQCALFRQEVSFLKEKGHAFPMVHLLDSIGLVRRPEDQYDAVRAGAFLYGNVPPDYARFDRRCPTVRFCARVTRVQWVPAGEGVGYGEEPLERDTLVATLAAGYVDGYPRLLQRLGEVELNGKRARVLGRVCMDQMMVDVTDIPETVPGDTAVLLGDGISLNEFAAWGDMNRNEVTCMIGRRVPRIYLRDGRTRAVVCRL